MIQRAGEFIYDSAATDEAAVRIGPSVLAGLEDGLAGLGFQIVADDAFGVIALHVVDNRHVGTAYVEFKNGGVELRIVLVQDRFTGRVDRPRRESAGGNGATALHPG